MENKNTAAQPLDLDSLARFDYVPGEAGRMIIGQDDNGPYVLRSDVAALLAQARASLPEGATLASKEDITGTSQEETTGASDMLRAWSVYMIELEQTVADLRAQLASERQAKEYEQRHAAESETALAQAHAQLAAKGQGETAAWLDRNGRMTDALRSFMEGMSVSMDVSTGEHDAGNRYFGLINEVMDDDGDKNGVTLLVYDAQPNFAAPACAQPDRGAVPGETLADRVVAWSAERALSPASQPVAPEAAQAGTCSVCTNLEAQLRAVVRQRDAVISAHAQQEAAPAEQKLMPAKPTKEMLDAARLAWACNAGFDIDAIYAAMHAAAPTTVPDHSEREAANARRLSENDMRDIAVEAGLWPNTIDCWLPALRRYTDAVLARQSPATIAAGQEGANAKDAARWTKTPPTEQADYWNWDGDPDHAPMIYHVLWSGTAKKCFVSIGQYGIDEAIWCDNFDGWWLKIEQPSIPSDDAAMAAAPSSEKGGANHD
jgi:hypothetical protein